MKPTRDSHATLVDLLDRVLDKGLVLDADLIIDVAGIPLLGVNLKACLAGIDTMLEYGMWRDWDDAQRTVVRREPPRTDVCMESGGESTSTGAPFSRARSKSEALGGEAK